MRPLPTSPTNTFQSPKVATSAGLDASSFVPVLDAALAGLVAALAGGRSALAAQRDAATNPEARRDERTSRVIRTNPLNGGLTTKATPGRRASLPSDPGKIPAFRLACPRRGCNPAFG